ncbi:hypothetical protein NWF32_14265 [Pseudomonas qingdaonensis]|nr:hypothetical protein [Pseudomonas qingdaonensis]
MLNEPKSSHLIDELILDGLRYQAQQQLAWLQQAPIPLAIQAFLNSNSPHPQLPDVLKDGATTCAATGCAACAPTTGAPWPACTRPSARAP